MSRSQQLFVLLCMLPLTSSFADAQSGTVQQAVINFAAPSLPDPVLQHSKETYILNGCAYCHGVDLMVRNGEAADLLHSDLVGKDDDGNLISPLLRAGIPQTPKLSPMPQFSDLSDHQIADIVRWIHYARQRGRYKDLTETTDMGLGVAVDGKAYFEKKCSSCHSTAGDVARISNRYDPATLKIQILYPKFLDTPQSWEIDQLHDTKAATARRQHLKLLENYSAKDLANLGAYFQTMK